MPKKTKKPKKAAKKIANKPTTRREDVNQAAARILREATKNR